MNLDHFSDEELVSQLVTFSYESRSLTARMLVYLIEVEERRIHLKRACSSMFDFCTRLLGFSEGQAYRRISGARLVRKYPWLLEQIERGEVFLSALAQIQSFVTNENVRDLVASTRGKKRLEIEVMLAQRFGGPMRTPAHEGAFLRCDAELLGLLQRARELMSHAVPDGDPLKLAKRALKMFIADAEKKRRGPVKARATSKPAMNRPTAATKRFVRERDGDQCTYVDPVTGNRCPARAFVELDHEIAVAVGGGHGPDDLRAACRAHNQWFAEQTFGREYIRKRIHLRQQKKKPPA